MDPNCETLADVELSHDWRVRAMLFGFTLSLVLVEAGPQLAQCTATRGTKISVHTTVLALQQSPTRGQEPRIGAQPWEALPGGSFRCRQRGHSWTIDRSITLALRVSGAGRVHKNVSTDATARRTFSVLRANLLTTESVFSHSSAPTTNSIAPPSATGNAFPFLSSANAFGLRRSSATAQHPRSR
ncbi:hypothetical protein BC826DRAFT_1036267 [Russula brevipes]|nr:hypothetical protein BC826DRAFT_1036267 [Russula brevipes]